MALENRIDYLLLPSSKREEAKPIKAFFRCFHDGNGKKNRRGGSIKRKTLGRCVMETLPGYSIGVIRTADDCRLQTSKVELFPQRNGGDGQFDNRLFS